MVHCSRSLLGLFVSAIFLGEEGVLDRGFVAVYLVGCRGDVRGWLDVWLFPSWLQEGYINLLVVSLGKFLFLAGRQSVLVLL